MNWFAVHAHNNKALTQFWLTHPSNSWVSLRVWYRWNKSTVHVKFHSSNSIIEKYWNLMEIIENYQFSIFFPTIKVLENNFFILWSLKKIIIYNIILRLIFLIQLAEIKREILTPLREWSRTIIIFWQDTVSIFSKSINSIGI